MDNNTEGLKPVVLIIAVACGVGGLILIVLLYIYVKRKMNVAKTSRYHHQAVSKSRAAIDSLYPNNTRPSPTNSAAFRSPGTSRPASNVHDTRNPLDEVRYDIQDFDTSEEIELHKRNISGANAAMATDAGRPYSKKYGAHNNFM